MKKIITILTCLCLILTLGACSTSREEEVVTVEKTVKAVEDMKIVAPSGAPSVAFYNFSDSASFETNGTPSNIVAMMSAAEGPDVVVIDTVSGVNAINNGAPYLLAATITFGNFYIAATGNDEDGVMSADDNIILFGQNQTPDLVWHYIYGSEFDEAVSFVAAAGDAAAVLQTGNDAQGNPADYVFLAEPALFASLNKNEKASIYANVQELYTAKSGTGMIQASVFVKNDLSDESVNDFLAVLEKDINAALEDPTVVKAGFDKISEDESKAKFGVMAAPVVAVLKQNNRLGLGFKKAYDIKEDIDTFLNVMSKDSTSEEIYFK